MTFHTPSGESGRSISIESHAVCRIGRQLSHLDPSCCLAMQAVEVGSNKRVNSLEPAFPSFCKQRGEFLSFDTGLCPTALEATFFHYVSRSSRDSRLRWRHRSHSPGAPVWDIHKLCSAHWCPATCRDAPVLVTLPLALRQLNTGLVTGSCIT